MTIAHRHTARTIAPTSPTRDDLPVEKIVQTILYRITHLPTGRWYIGIHNLPPGWSDPFACDGYMGSGSAILALVADRPAEEFRKDVLLVLDDRAAALEVEAGLVGPETVSNPKCLNQRGGGEGGLGLSEEARDRLGRAIIQGRFHRARERAEAEAERARQAARKPLREGYAEEIARRRASARAYYERMTPDERRAEMKRRRDKGLQNKQERSA